MRATITLEDSLLADLMRFTEARSRTAAVAQAIGEWVRRKRLEQIKSLRGTQALDEGIEASDEISTLYETIARRAEALDPAAATGDPELSRAWAKLRRLQAEEADRYQEAFEASLAMPIDAGKALLERARALRRRFENPSADHAATDDTHRA